MAKPLLNEEERALFGEIYYKYTYDAATELMNKTFGKQWTIEQLRSYVNNNKWPRSRSNKGRIGYVVKNRLLTVEEHEFLLKIYKGRSLKETTEMINKKFDKHLSYSQIKGYFRNHNLTCDRNTKFKKGHKSWNKGKKFPGNTNGGCFKKGHILMKYRSVGSERIDVDGYSIVKIADPNKWKAKHKIIWEKANGPIPKGHVILFLDQNKQNFNLDNLVLVKQAELLKFNQQKATNDAVVNKSKLLIAKLQVKVGKLKRKRKESLC